MFATVAVNTLILEARQSMTMKSADISSSCKKGDSSVVSYCLEESVLGMTLQ